MSVSVHPNHKNNTFSRLPPTVATYTVKPGELQTSFLSGYSTRGKIENTHFLIDVLFEIMYKLILFILLSAFGQQESGAVKSSRIILQPCKHRKCLPYT